MNQNTKIGVAVGAASILSAAAGAVGGYFFAKTRLEKMYSEFASEEIREAKMFYSRLHKDEYKTPAEAVQALIPEKEAAEALLAYHGQQVTVTHHDGTQEKIINLPDGGFIAQDRNIFEDDNPEENPDEWERELTARSNDRPYILAKEEFLQAEAGYSQVTLTYYEGDDTLADERDQPINDVDYTIGPMNLRFGYHSDDKNVVYIRNDKLGLEFEVLRSFGKYAEEVLGHHPKDHPS